MSKTRTEEEAGRVFEGKPTTTNLWNVVGNVLELKSKPCRKIFMKVKGEEEATNPISTSNLALFYVETKDRFYVTSASCPHARGPLDQGDIEEFGSSHRVVCPLHYYSFDLETGESPTGLVVKTYKTEIRGDDLYVLTPHPVSLKR